MVFIDTECCGYHGPIVLIQYAENDGEIILHEPWKVPVKDTMELIEWIVEQEVVMFNCAFDWFHICQMYTTLCLLDNKSEPPQLYEYASKEILGREGYCLKPRSILDLMLHARKGPYQNTMDRDDIRIKRVPTDLAYKLHNYLNEVLPFKDLYFARKKDKTDRWGIFDLKDDLGDTLPDFKDIVLKFAPSSALKALAQDALGIDDDVILKFTDVDVDPMFHPVEYGYAPFYFGEKGQWPDVIEKYIDHWAFNNLAREYAKKDVVYTRALYEHFGRPSFDDDDSILACMVGANRWRGYAIDCDRLEKLMNSRQEIVDNLNRTYNCNFNSTETVRRFLSEYLTDMEQTVLKVNDKITTKGMVLEEIAKWKEQEVCPGCDGMGCPNCEDGMVPSDRPHKAAERAQMILDYRHALKEVEMYSKLLRARRLHADFEVIGTKSSRMSGSGGLNAQGIKRAKETRSCFNLADRGMVLCGGDFEGFEVVLADACYNDPDLRNELQSGKKIHALFGQFLFPPMTYEDIMATKGKEGANDKYMRSKNGVFALLYGGDANTLSTRVGVEPKVAEEAFQAWIAKYKVWGKARQKTFDKFCTMVQKGGIGTKVEWKEPTEYMESMLGFRRYFTLENQICRVLFKIAEEPPKEWEKIKTRVVRRDREQSALGATRSALLAASFGIQAANMRAASNHEIQSTGAGLCKRLQTRIWGLQPAGIHNWRLQPLNVHDEIMVPTVPEYVPEIRKIVDDFVEEHKKLVPLLAIDWKDKLSNWAGK